jgi:hypothetical protein
MASGRNSPFLTFIQRPSLLRSIREYRNSAAEAGGRPATLNQRTFSHAVTWVSRERTEFKFQLAILNINPHSIVGVRVGHPRESAWRKDLYDRFPWDWRQVAGAKNPFCRLVPCVPDFGVAAHAR